MQPGFHLQRVHPSSGCAFVAAKPFAHGDRMFQAGDRFPYQELGLHEAQAIQLWNACYLNVDTRPPVQPVPPAAPATPFMPPRIGPQPAHPHPRASRR